MERKEPRLPGCQVQNGRCVSRFRRETIETLACACGNRKCVTVYPECKPACPTCRSVPLAETGLEVDVELPEVLPKTKHGKGKPKSSDLECRIREAGKSADPSVELKRIRQEHGYPDEWPERIGVIYDIEPSA